MLRRRTFLATAFAASMAAGCARIAPRATPTDEPDQATAAQLQAWRHEAQAMLSDALDTLRTFDVFAAYRVAITPSSSLRPPSSLAWDPPTSAAWDAATHVSRGLHGRADQLFRGITTATVATSAWRTQRRMADATHDLIDLGDALLAYRDRVDRLPPGDASGALDLLTTAWTRWEDVAARWDTTRAEPIACG